jgi:hypothetical protein
MLVRRHDLVRRTEVAMTEQPEGGAKKASARKSPAKKNPAKKNPAKKRSTTREASTARKTPAGTRPAAEKTAAPGTSPSRRASTTSAPRATKQATKKATAPVEEADRAQRAEPSGGVLDAAAGAAGAAVQLVGTPVAAARRVLDAKGGLPAYLGAGALAVAGVIQWPVAAAGSAGYAALRKWGRELPEPLRTLTGSSPEQSPGDETGTDRNAPA